MKGIFIQCEECGVSDRLQIHEGETISEAFSRLYEETNYDWVEVETHCFCSEVCLDMFSSWFEDLVLK